MGRPPMGWAPAVLGRFLKPGGRGGRPKLALALPTIPLVRENARSSIQAAFNYATPLFELQHFDEVKNLLRYWMPVAQRVLGDNHEVTLRMKDVYARALYKADGATLDDLLEAVKMLQDAERTARRVLGAAHPHTVYIANSLQSVLRVREMNMGSL